MQVNQGEPLSDTNGAKQRLGHVAFCSNPECRAEIGYRPPSWFARGHSLCPDCARSATRRAAANNTGPRVDRATRPCARCGQAVERRVADLRYENWFCDAEHYHEWKSDRCRRQPTGRDGKPKRLCLCRGCGKVSAPHAKPENRKSYDAATHSYLCQQCRFEKKRYYSPCRYCGTPVRCTVSRPVRYCNMGCRNADRCLRWVTRECALGKRCQGTYYFKTPHRDAGQGMGGQYHRASQRYCSRTCSNRATLARRNIGIVRPKCKLEGCSRTVTSGEHFCSREHYRLWGTRHGSAGGRHESQTVAARLQVALDYGLTGPEHIARFAGMSKKAVYAYRSGRDTGTDACGNCGEWYCPKRRLDANVLKEHRAQIAELVDAASSTGMKWDQAAAIEALVVTAATRLAKCGTQAGYVSHHKHDEEPCDRCRIAQSKYDRDRWRKSHPVPRVAKCGTSSGANRHRRLGEPLCEACRNARNADHRDWKAANRIRRSSNPPDGL
jgi:hypothetical protein